MSDSYLESCLDWKAWVHDWRVRCGFQVRHRDGDLIDVPEFYVLAGPSTDKWLNPVVVDLATYSLGWLHAPTYGEVDGVDEAAQIELDEWARR